MRCQYTRSNQTVSECTNANILLCRLLFYEIYFIYLNYSGDVAQLVRAPNSIRKVAISLSMLAYKLCPLRKTLNTNIRTIPAV